MTRYAVALGSNLGDRRHHLTRAVVELGGVGSVVAVSGLYETDPVGGPEQGRYLNAVVVLETDLGPERILDGLQSIEDDHQRQREVRWGPRTLDLDLISTDGDPVITASLVIPHARSGERRFVLEPLNEVWPDAVVSGGATAREALKHVLNQPVSQLEEVWPPPLEAC